MNLIHNLGNVCSSLYIIQSLVYNDIMYTTTFTGIWTFFDLLFIINIKKSPKKNSIFIHHIFTILCCYFALLKNESNIETVSFYMFLFELTTPFVCFANIVNNETTRFLKNYVWVSVRLPVSILIIFELFDFISPIYRSYVFVIISLTYAWTFGNSIIGRNSNLISYLNPMITCIHCNDHYNMMFVILGFITSFLFYEYNFKSINQIVIASHAYYYFTPGGLLNFIYSIIACSQCVIFINNFHELMVLLLVIDTWNENMLPFIIMSLYIYVKGGPKKLDYGNKIVWHAAATTIIANSIKKYYQ